MNHLLDASNAGNSPSNQLLDLLARLKAGGFLCQSKRATGNQTAPPAPHVRETNSNSNSPQPAGPFCKG